MPLARPSHRELLGLARDSLVSPPLPKTQLLITHLPAFQPALQTTWVQQPWPTLLACVQHSMRKKALAAFKAPREPAVARLEFSCVLGTFRGRGLESLGHWSQPHVSGSEPPSLSLAVSRVTQFPAAPPEIAFLDLGENCFPNDTPPFHKP